MKYLHPKSIWLFFFQGLRAVLFLLLFPLYFLFIFLSTEISIGITPIFFVLLIVWFIILLVIAYIWAKLSYQNYKYELTDNGFKKELGVIRKKYVTIPYDRIQNVDIDRGIIARILGLSDIKIQTAGMSGMMGAEGRLPGLSVQDAEIVRDDLIKRAKTHTNQGV
ncbi:MAG: hypothetical protein A3A97_04970 [Candidatus Terrybacteria bacterium RIFCSPLOWO2_01_FULL_40_23]|uniref:YdbS-like PH domain-containing protein n=1 Tax=Candidatus Terrybacteria bacterium RIFCSPLOWO2_01_FULL_40_23 TaxID=1802366 RepID=A0A1G2PV80_9BACT|nr:MAG: hypothetical protein A3A97_04970 [Candidatus Terrybacteria bacterium RIFCSPLOWO2_01_FULL_40_23]